MINGKLSSATVSPLTERTHTALKLLDRLVLLGCHAVHGLEMVLASRTGLLPCALHLFLGAPLTWSGTPRLSSTHVVIDLRVGRWLVTLTLTVTAALLKHRYAVGGLAIGTQAEVGIGIGMDVLSMSVILDPIPALARAWRHRRVHQRHWHSTSSGLGVG